jgi:hypothetical protein
MVINCILPAVTAVLLHQDVQQPTQNLWLTLAQMP